MSMAFRCGGLQSRYMLPAVLKNTTVATGCGTTIRAAAPVHFVGRQDGKLPTYAFTCANIECTTFSVCCDERISFSFARKSSSLLSTVFWLANCTVRG